MKLKKIEKENMVCEEGEGWVVRFVKEMVLLHVDGSSLSNPTYGHMSHKKEKVYTGKLFLFFFNAFFLSSYVFFSTRLFFMCVCLCVSSFFVILF